MTEVTSEATYGIMKASVASAIDEYGSWWRPCSGCHETNEGHETGHFHYSDLFRCHVGSGCCECGGIGVRWEHYTDEELAAMVAEGAGYAAERDAIGPGQTVRLNVERGKAGLWYVTAPDERGLLCTGSTMADAVAEVPRALIEMRKAREPNADRDTQPS